MWATTTRTSYVVRTTHDTRCSVRWKRVPSPRTPPVKFKRDTSRVLKQPADSGDGVSDVEPRTACAGGVCSRSKPATTTSLRAHTQHPDQSHVWQQHALRCFRESREEREHQIRLMWDLANMAGGVRAERRFHSTCTHEHQHACTQRHPTQPTIHPHQSLCPAALPRVITHLGRNHILSTCMADIWVQCRWTHPTPHATTTTTVATTTTNNRKPPKVLTQHTRLIP